MMLAYSRPDRIIRHMIRHIRETVRLPPSMNSAPTGRLFVKSDIGGFYENM
jgi:hypothetical protein